MYIKCNIITIIYGTSTTQYVLPLIHVLSHMFGQVFTVTAYVPRAAGARTVPSCVTVRTGPPVPRTRGPVNALQDSEGPPARGVSHIKQTRRVEYMHTMHAPCRGCQQDLRAVT